MEFPGSKAGFKFEGVVCRLRRKAGQHVSAVRLREGLLEATGRPAEPLRPITLKQGIVQPDNMRIVVVSCEIVLGFGIGPATGYDGPPYLLRQLFDAFGAERGINRRNRGPVCW